MLIGFEHELHRRPAEESKSLDIILLTVKNATIEKVLSGVCVDKETLQTVGESEVNIAMDPMVMIGHPEVAEAFGQAPNAVVAQAIVFGQYDFDGVAADRKLLGETLDNIPQPSDLGDRGALRRDHGDEHKRLNRFQLAGCNFAQA